MYRTRFMKIDIITLFPKMFEGPFRESIIKRAQEKSLVEIKIHDLRKWGIGKHRQVDDRPFGGGVGMLLMVEPIYKALKELKVKKQESEKVKVILLSPQGGVFAQKKAKELSKLDRLVLIAGRYEGFDSRIREHLIDEEISIGNYVLTGGELPAMIITDTIVRLIPGVLKKADATKLESHSKIGYTEHPQYTRPEKFKNWSVPKVLLSGNHAKIESWKIKKTKNKP